MRETLLGQRGQSSVMQVSRMRNLATDRSFLAGKCDFSLCMNGRKKKIEIWIAIVISISGVCERALYQCGHLHEAAKYINEV